MSSSSLSSRKSKVEAIEDYLMKAFKVQSLESIPEEDCLEDLLEDDEADEDDLEITPGVQNPTERSNGPKKKPKRRRPTKKNKGKAKEIDEDQQEHKIENKEESFQLPDEFPFNDSISALPLEQRMAKLQELHAFMEKLRDKALSDQQKLTDQAIKELANEFMNELDEALPK